MATAVSFDEFDTSKWPVVRVTFGRAPDSDAEIEKFQDRMCGMLYLALHGSAHVEAKPLLVTFFIDGVVGASIMQQLKAAQVIDMVAPMVKAGAIRATAIVVTSEAAHDLLTYILSLAPLSSPHQVCDSAEAAAAWLAQFAP